MHTVPISTSNKDFIRYQFWKVFEVHAFRVRANGLKGRLKLVNTSLLIYYVS